MSEPQTWRELLGQCLTSGQEKERIASLVGVNPLTLTRWVNDEAKPRLSNIHRLLDALPKYRSQFLELLPDDLKPVFDEAKGLDGVGKSLVVDQSTHGEPEGRAVLAL